MRSTHATTEQNNAFSIAYNFAATDFSWRCKNLKKKQIWKDVILLYSHLIRKRSKLIHLGCNPVSKRDPILKICFRNFSLTRYIFVCLYGGTLKLFFDWKIYVHFFLIWDIFFFYHYYSSNISLLHVVCLMFLTLSTWLKQTWDWYWDVCHIQFFFNGHLIFFSLWIYKSMSLNRYRSSKFGLDFSCSINRSHSDLI